MPTYNDETLGDRYRREHQDMMDIYAAMTPEQIHSMALELHNTQAMNADLLEALKVLASHWPHYAANINMTRIDHDAIAMARRAIVKATGEQP